MKTDLFQSCGLFQSYTVGGMPIGTTTMENSMNLTEAEYIKRWQEYTEELYRKDVHDPDNHNGGITHLEPDPGM